MKRKKYPKKAMDKAAEFVEIYLMAKKEGSDLRATLKRYGTPKQQADWSVILNMMDYLYELKGEEYIRRSLKEFIFLEEMT